MTTPTTITVATPCYNEAESLPSYFRVIAGVLDDLRASGWRVEHLLINDGSRDGTAELIDEFASARPATRAFHHPRNLGYGAAIKTALALADTEWVVFVDADSNYDQRLILGLVERVAPGVDVVNVSIFAPGGGAGYPWYRLVLSSIAGRIYKTLFPIATRGVATMTCGFRLYRKSVVPRLFPRADDFVATAESMLRALRAGVSVVEFPATNAKREHGVSKLRKVRVSLHHLRFALRARLGLLGPPLPVEEHLRRIGALEGRTLVPGAVNSG
jgi:glycosyltransferase involved in cell wall biosynthesis